MTRTAATGSTLEDARSPPASAAHGALSALPYSRVAQRLSRRYGRVFSGLPPWAATGPITRAQLQTAYAYLLALEPNPAAALRMLRSGLLLRVMAMDCDRHAALSVVCESMTELAEFALDVACNLSLQQLDAQHGAPLAAGGQRAQLWVLGMGKLGARELNVSSDIDLIYVYDDDGETAGLAHGRGKISNQEYFGKVVKAIYSLIAESSEHGFVFRIDTALRPNGNSGLPAVSLASLETYFSAQGREWERFAWLKSRVVAPLSSLQDSSAQRLGAVVLPFVFRRYLDYSVFDALRQLHRQIREHALRRSAGRPERANDVKLSRGGIREIEFTVQLLQLVRGGQFPELRTRATLAALPLLAQAGLIPPDVADALAQAYVFLRRTEHRIQYLDDQQTHVLPTQDDDLTWIAQTLGYPACCPFLHDLDAHRERVAQEFDRLLGGSKPLGCKPCQTACGQTGALSQEADTPWLPATTGAFGQALVPWLAHPRLLAMREDAKTRLQQLLTRTQRWVDEGRVTPRAALASLAWMEPLLRRESYLALLLERPAVHERLLRLLGLAQWPAHYLMRHPGVIDELAGGALLGERFDAPTFVQELHYRHEALRHTREDNDEALLNLLRRAHHAELFRILARDVEGLLTVEEVADDLSALADAVLATTAEWCWQRLASRPAGPARFAIIAYGKLGGKELGYGSDLDIVFVYDPEPGSDTDAAAVTYTALARKLIHWLTLKTGEGDLFEIDTALRPNGNSGLLVSRFDAYANYQQQRGSSTAWTWEHQAMTRARFCVGWAPLKSRFDAVREAVIHAPRDLPALRREVLTMRQKVAQSRPVKPGCFDVKHSPGGMLDAEFAVQYLVLAQGQRHPGMSENAGNIALLLRAESLGLLPAGCGQAAAAAYRELRKIQHQARLDQQPTQVLLPALLVQRQAIERLWQAVFETARNFE
ncbi:MAG: bifunctional [glutamate--ammonia ligase]-adenylyl-L-tyrosine phosphorylase/[glutamate--ammonia-ligase] adenylyltransferase [Burkholderiaceae bacterium]